MQAAEQEELHDAVVHQHRSARDTCHLSDPAQACGDNKDRRSQKSIEWKLAKFPTKPVDTMVNRKSWESLDGELDITVKIHENARPRIA